MIISIHATLTFHTVLKNFLSPSSEIHLKQSFFGSGSDKGFQTHTEECNCLCLMARLLHLLLQEKSSYDLLMIKIVTFGFIFHLRLWLNLQSDLVSSCPSLHNRIGVWCQEWEVKKKVKRLRWHEQRWNLFQVTKPNLYTKRSQALVKASKNIFLKTKNMCLFPLLLSQWMHRCWYSCCWRWWDSARSFHGHQLDSPCR